MTWSTSWNIETPTHTGFISVSQQPLIDAAPDGWRVTRPVKLNRLAGSR
jgi:hypothetical protein